MSTSISEGLAIFNLKSQSAPIESKLTCDGSTTIAEFGWTTYPQPVVLIVFQAPPPGFTKSVRYGQRVMSAT